VSSILKALEKVERDSPREEVIPSFPQEIDPKRAVRRRAKKRKYVRWCVFSGVLLVLGTGAWILFNSPLLTDRPPEPSPGARENRLSLTTAGETGMTGSAPVLSAPNMKVKRPVTLPDTKTAPEGNQPREKILSPGVPKETRPPASVPPVVPINLPESAMENPETPKEPEADRGIDLSRYKLEAIVWSNNPESRFAVINGRIVHEGGTIEGLRVKAIERNHVSVESGDRQAELRFTLE